MNMEARERGKSYHADALKGPSRHHHFMRREVLPAASGNDIGFAGIGEGPLVLLRQALVRAVQRISGLDERRRAGAVRVAIPEYRISKSIAVDLHRGAHAYTGSPPGEVPTSVSQVSGIAAVGAGCERGSMMELVDQLLIHARPSSADPLPPWIIPPHVPSACRGCP